MIRAHLTVISRRTLRQWQAERLAAIDRELGLLRGERTRLRKLLTQVARCDRCRVLKTVTLQADGWWLCVRCAEHAKEATA